MEEGHLIPVWTGHSSACLTPHLACLPGQPDTPLDYSLWTSLLYAAYRYTIYHHYYCGCAGSTPGLVYGLPCRPACHLPWTWTDFFLPPYPSQRLLVGSPLPVILYATFPRTAVLPHHYHLYYHTTCPPLWFLWWTTLLPCCHHWTIPLAGLPLPFFIFYYLLPAEPYRSVCPEPAWFNALLLPTTLGLRLPQTFFTTTLLRTLTCYYISYSACCTPPPYHCGLWFITMTGTGRRVVLFGTIAVLPVPRFLNLIPA